MKVSFPNINTKFLAPAVLAGTLLTVPLISKAQSNNDVYVRQNQTEIRQGQEIDEKDAYSKGFGAALLLLGFYLVGAFAHWIHERGSYEPGPDEMFSDDIPQNEADSEKINGEGGKEK